MLGERRQGRGAHREAVRDHRADELDAGGGVAQMGAAAIAGIARALDEAALVGVIRNGSPSSAMKIAVAR